MFNSFYLFLAVLRKARVKWFSFETFRHFPSTKIGGKTKTTRKIVGIEVVKKQLFQHFQKKLFHSSFLLSRKFFFIQHSLSLAEGDSLSLTSRTHEKLTSYHLIRLENPLSTVKSNDRGKESIWDLFNRVNSLIQLKSQVQNCLGFLYICGKLFSSLSLW